MIRFINLGKQINDFNEFAWFDTITDTFVEFNGTQTWENWEEFEVDYNASDPSRKSRCSIERLIMLFPKREQIKKGDMKWLRKK